MISNSLDVHMLLGCLSIKDRESIKDSVSIIDDIIKYLQNINVSYLLDDFYEALDKTVDVFIANCNEGYKNKLFNCNQTYRCTTTTILLAKRDMPLRWMMSLLASMIEDYVYHANMLQGRHDNYGLSIYFKEVKTGIDHIHNINLAPTLRVNGYCIIMT